MRCEEDSECDPEHSMLSVDLRREQTAWQAEAKSCLDLVL